MNGSFSYFENSHTPMVRGIMLNTFFPKKANPVVSHIAMIVAPFGFTLRLISVNMLAPPATAALIRVAPSPPTAM
jgi:hypothetical protein